MNTFNNTAVEIEDYNFMFPEIIIIRFTEKDIITTSDDDGEWDHKG